MKRIWYGISLFLLLALTSNACAKNDTIYFGDQNGSPSFGYSPSTFQVNVGDIIVWMGPFDAHTLKATLGSTTVIDFGASNNTPPGGTSYSYTVTEAGSYQFECTLHASIGMTGSFTAAASGVDIPTETTMQMDPIFPNPAMEDAMVHFTLQNPAHVTLRIYNATGTLMQTPTNEDMGAGFHMLMIDNTALASGTYQYVLQAGEAVLQRKMIVVK